MRAVIEAVNEITGGLIPLLVRRGGALASHGSQCILRHLSVSDHPVCGASVASQLFIDAAATPPHEEGITKFSQLVSLLDANQTCGVFACGSGVIRLPLKLRDKDTRSRSAMRLVPCFFPDRFRFG